MGGELFKMLLEFENGLTDSVLEEGFNGIDWNGNGWIDQQEFVAAVHGHMGLASPEAASHVQITPRGTRKSTIQICEVQVAVPYGCFPGQMLQIEHKGLYYNVQIPEGVNQGEVFTTSLEEVVADLFIPNAIATAVQKIEVVVTVPDGVVAGQPILIHHEGQNYEVPVPAGHFPGSQFKTECYVH